MVSTTTLTTHNGWISSALIRLTICTSITSLCTSDSFHAWHPWSDAFLYYHFLFSSLYTPIRFWCSYISIRWYRVTLFTLLGQGCAMFSFCNKRIQHVRWPRSSGLWSWLIVSRWEPILDWADFGRIASTWLAVGTTQVWLPTQPCCKSALVFSATTIRHMHETTIYGSYICFSEQYSCELLGMYAALLLILHLHALCLTFQWSHTTNRCNRVLLWPLCCDRGRTL